MIDVKVDTSKMEKALGDFAALTGKDMPAEMRNQGGTLVGHVIGLTPPAGGKGEAMTAQGGVSLDAKRRGESRIAADIARIFPTTKAPLAEVQSWIRNGVKVAAPDSGGRKLLVRDIAFNLANMKTVHKGARNPRSGRTRTEGGLFTAFARASTLKQYIRQEQKKIGTLAAGWLAAADALRTNKRYMPAWITRQGHRPGGAEISEGKGRIRIHIHNDQDWFPGDMSRRVQLALDRRERGIYKAMEAILERRARAAEKAQGV